MKRYIAYIGAVLSLFLVGACSDRFAEEAGYGYLAVNLTEDLSESLIVKSEASEGEDQTEGDEGTDEIQVEPYSIKVINSSGAVVGEVADHHEVTADNPIKVLMGSYIVMAQNKDVPDASFEDGFYGGTVSVDIEAEETKTIDIECGRSDVKFSVEFPAEFEDLFTEYYVEVTSGVGDRLRLSSCPDEADQKQRGFDAKASFKVTGELVWNLYMKNTDSKDDKGGVYTYTKTIEDVKQGQHYHLVFSLAEQEIIDGVFSLKVKIDGEMVSNSHDLILDFDMQGLPSFSTSSGWEIKEGLTFPVGNSDPVKKMTFDFPSKARNLIMSHSNEMLTELGMPENMDLVGASDAEIASLAALGINTAALTEESLKGEIDITSFIAGLTIGRYEIRFLAIDQKGHFIRPELAFEITSDVEAEALEGADAWARFVTLEGRYFSKEVPEGLTFQYKLASDTEWTSMPESKMKINESALTFSARLDGLQPLSQYQYRAVTADDKDTKVCEFVTESAEVIHNLSFDSWYADGDAWYPNLDLNDNYIWDSANGGTASLGYIPTRPEENDLAVKGEGKAAARLETMQVSILGIKKLAAGNIYTGKFDKVSGVGAELDWGVPFKSRPLALRAYYKYAPKTINKAEGIHADKSGQTDQCQILMFLTDWSAPFHINTDAKKFVDQENDPGIIAFGAYYSSNTDSEYVQVTIPLVYRSLDRIPNYVVVAGAASRYGDYFTGGVGSVLLLDEFEFIYDPAELTDEQFEAVFSNFR